MATNQIPVTLTPTPEAIPAELAPILRGEQGIPGDGMPAGGDTGQVLAKASADDFDLEWVAQTGGGGAGATNLAYTASPTGGTVTSDTGTDATLTLADATNAGLMAPAQHTKLAGIATGATAVTVDATPTDGSSNAVSSNGVFDALAGKSDSGHNHSGVYDPAGTAASAVAAHAGATDPHGDRAFATSAASTAQSNAISTASGDATTKANAAQAAAIAASAPAAHVGAGGTAHADAVAAGAAGFMTGADKTKLDGIAAGAQVNPASTDAVAEGSTNLYHTAGRVLGQVLTGLSTAAGTVVEATHTILQAIGFLQKQVSDNTTAISGKQATLVSGTNIKSVNGTTLLGSGDLTVSAAPGGSTTQVQYNNAGAFAGASGITTTGTELAIASGTQTTSKPVLDLSQTWNDAAVTFTGVKLNVTDTASAAASLLADFQIGGVGKAKISKAGDITAANQFISGTNGSESTPYIKGAAGRGFYEGVSGIVYTDGTARWRASASSMQIQRSAIFGWANVDGSVQTHQAVETGFGWNAAGVVEVNNGTAGTFRDLKLRNLIASGGVVTLASFTVATLPSASTSGAGAMAYVTDSNATTYRATVAGGGSDKVTVTSDGTNWIITG